MEIFYRVAVCVMFVPPCLTLEMGPVHLPRMYHSSLLALFFAVVFVYDNSRNKTHCSDHIVQALLSNAWGGEVWGWEGEVKTMQNTTECGSGKGGGLQQPSKRSYHGKDNKGKGSYIESHLLTPHLLGQATLCTV